MASWPLCRKIYDQLKAKSILHTEMFYVQLDGEDKPSDVLPKRLTKDQLDLVNEVIDEYAKLSSTQLESLTQ
jgi:restriction endonuclease Mrr